jgi:hypothetical protein
MNKSPQAEALEDARVALEQAAAIADRVHEARGVLLAESYLLLNAVRLLEKGKGFSSDQIDKLAGVADRITKAGHRLKGIES